MEININDMADLQIALGYTKAKILLNRIEKSQGEALYIINKNMEARVLFYYNEKDYFISDPIQLNIDYIEYADKYEIDNLCHEISDKFENTDLLQLSTLIRDKKSIILNYMLNSLIIEIDRVDDTIEDIISLEMYNDVVIFNLKGIYKVFKHNDMLCYDKFDVDFTRKNYELTEEILKDVYSDYDIFPHNYEYKEFNVFNVNDIAPNDKISPLITIAIVSSEELISIGYTKLDDDFKYKKKDLTEIINELIKIANESDDIEADITAALDDLYYNYDTESVKQLN